MDFHIDGLSKPDPYMIFLDGYMAHLRAIWSFFLNIYVQTELAIDLGYINHLPFKNWGKVESEVTQMTKKTCTTQQHQGTSHTPRSLKFSRALIDKISEFYMAHSKCRPKSDSEGILYGLLAYAGRKINVMETRRLHITLIPSAEERLTLHPTSVRIPDALYADLQETAAQCEVTAQEIAVLILVDVIAQNNPPRHALRIPGSKRDPRMQKAISNILCNCNNNLGSHYYDASVEPCGGALEIHQNFVVADEEIIGDIDPEKVNFYRVIQKHHKAFVSCALSYEVNQDTFKRLNANVPCNKIERAVRYFYLCLNSTRNNGEKYKGLKLRTYWNAVAATYILHTRLQATRIYLRDLFKTLESRNLPTGKTLLIVDPPYLATHAYASNLTYQEHERLSKRLLSLCKGENRDLLYFCRITDGHDKIDPNEQAIKKKNDQIMQGLIDDLYFGHGLYYTDVHLDHGIIERIITSFPFEGATLYGRKNDRHGKVTDMSEEFADPDPCASSSIEMGVK